MNKEISKEEAIEILAEQRCFKSGKIRQAYDMAIESLEQKPSVISDEEIVQYAESITLDEWEQNTIISAAIWMRKLLTNK